jgi:apolipoprotein D and lipocalin family protein
MKKLKLALFVFTLIISISFNSCSTIPIGAVAIENFEKEKYLGQWYEIARLDFKFEKNLNNTTANYSINKNGTLKVDNKGYNTKKQKWSQSIGKAKFINGEEIGSLKVSFFGPFYGGYNIIAVDSEYKYALVAGSSLDYLWILSRDTNIPHHIKSKYLNIAKAIGYNTEELIWVKHNK